MRFLHLRASTQSRHQLCSTSSSASNETVKVLPTGKRKRSLSDMDISDDSGPEDGQVASYASSVTLCAQSGATEPTASSENRLNAIEKMLVSQQDIIQKLLFASTAPPRSARTPDDIYEPPPACTPEDIYEPPPAPLTPTPEGIYNRTRIEAGFSDHCEWNAAYIHGLIRIRGERSRSITMDPPCGLCSTRGPAVCVMPAEDDPYYGFLVVENRVCCGWCEYEKAQGEEDQRLIEKGLKTSSTSAPTENQEREQEQAEPTKGKKQENLSACQSKIFISGEGLDREVMMTDIPRYLGVDSIVRPGTRRDPMTSEVTEGYYITAYRPPTSAMLVDLREDSAAWQAEKKKRKLDNATACVQELYSGKLSEGDYPRNYDQDEDAKIASLYSDLTSCKSASSILIADLEWQSETDSVHRYKRLGGLYY